MQNRFQAPLPDPLAREAESRWAAFCEAAQAASVALPLDPLIVEGLKKVLVCSDFVARGCRRNPKLLADLLVSGDLTRAYVQGEYRARVAAVLEPVAHRLAQIRSDPRPAADQDPLDELQQALRRLRKREMVRIACRDIAGWADLFETMTALSDWADACLDQTLALLYDWQCGTDGVPLGQDGSRQHMIVLGLGKLGGRELNFSSDVDLIFAYPHAGRTDKPGDPVNNDVFFTRLGRRLIKALGALTADGQVFRLDLRLRPDGENGPLVMSFDNMEDYYQLQGREWERYAWIKARVVAGDTFEGERLLNNLKPFVYRRYLDFGVFQALRDMKQKISLEVKRKGMDNNVKLGSGGIREVEFFGQVFQLLRGGVVPDLQQRPILAVLRTLTQQGYIEAALADDLEAAYIFLRQTEHRLQEFDDQQTHELPGTSSERLRLAGSLGHADWKTFALRLQEHRDTVHASFNSLLETREPPHQEAAAQNQLAELAGVWLNPDASEQVRRVLAAIGFEAPQEVVSLLAGLKNSLATRSLSAEGRERLDRLIPRVLQETAGTPNPTTILSRVMRLVEAIERRTCYIALLLENPSALRHLIRLAGASPWIASFLARRPVLLDELLDARTLYVPPRREQMAEDLRRKMKRIAPEDLEYQIEELCIFRQVNTLRVAAADITDVLPLMRVSDYLSDIAETVIAEVLAIAWEHLVRKHGKPTCNLAGAACDRGFAVIAYGKLGGLELGYDSDLDLVFIHAGEREQTDGRTAPLDNAQFFARLGQRVIHILTTPTAAGRIYEIDMRLRPSGSSGVLVSRFDAFQDYQSEEAWTWEHQALLRARAVSGDTGLIQWFERMRTTILTRPRDPDDLRTKVIQMRARMRKELLKPRTGRFDIKQDRGGIVDIEFLVQYLVLLNAHAYPELVRWSDNVRQLQALSENGILDENTAYFLRHAYLVYRATTHRLSLQEEAAFIADDRFDSLRRRVGMIWRRFFGQDPS